MRKSIVWINILQYNDIRKFSYNKLFREILIITEPIETGLAVA